MDVRNRPVELRRSCPRGSGGTGAPGAMPRSSEASAAIELRNRSSSLRTPWADTCGGVRRGSEGGQEGVRREMICLSTGFVSLR
eukprot:877971-Prorocentrum_minimum.AAC.2